MNVKLGQKVTDKLSGFTGIVAAITKYLYGCVSILVKPEGLDEKGEPKDGKWFDEPQLTEVITENETGGFNEPHPEKDTPSIH